MILKKFISFLYLISKGNLAFYDKQTNLLNRNWLEYHRKYLDKMECDIILFDIDHFKHINDTYGHLQGDNLIRLIADIIIALYPDEKSYKIRFGGDEFIAVITREDMKKDFLAVLPQGIVSYGITHKTAEEDFNSALDRADKEMYKMKEENKKNEKDN